MSFSMTTTGCILFTKLRNCAKVHVGYLELHAFSLPSDYFRFPKLKEYLPGARFSLNNDMQTATENWRNGQGCDF